MGEEGKEERIKIHQQNEEGRDQVRSDDEQRKEAIRIRNQLIDKVELNRTLD
jgi:hypothetical protein